MEQSHETLLPDGSTYLTDESCIKLKFLHSCLIHLCLILSKHSPFHLSFANRGNNTICLVDIFQTMLVLGLSQSWSGGKGACSGSSPPAPSPGVDTCVPSHGKASAQWRASWWRTRTPSSRAHSLWGWGGTESLVWDPISQGLHTFIGTGRTNGQRGNHQQSPSAHFKGSTWSPSSATPTSETSILVSAVSLESCYLLVFSHESF